MEKKGVGQVQKMDLMHGDTASRKKKPQMIIAFTPLNGHVFLARSTMVVDLFSFPSMHASHTHNYFLFLRPLSN